MVHRAAAGRDWSALHHESECGAVCAESVQTGYGGVECGRETILLVRSAEAGYSTTADSTLQPEPLPHHCIFRYTPLVGRGDC